jgi:tetratricopeptide (TPR) repeat protein
MPVEAGPVNSIAPSDAQFIPSEIYRKHAASQRRRNLGKTIFAWGVLVVVVAAGVIAYRSGFIPPLSNLQGKKAAPAASFVPDSKTALEAQQRASISAASELVATNDLEAAQKKLRIAADLNGPLTEELEKRISDIDASRNDPQLRQLRQREETLWQKALKSASNNRYIEAQRYLRQILQLGPGGLHREDAQTYLDRVIPQHLQELDLLTQARLDVAQGEFQSARAIVGQLTKNGSDPSKLVAEIDTKERAQILQLEKKYSELSQRDGEEVILQLNALWSKFNELSAAGGPMSGEALDYVNKIPETVVSLQARLKQKDADALFDKAVRDYRRAAKLSEKAGLVTARENFQSISRAAGPHAEEAAKLLDEVNKKLTESNVAPAQTSTPAGSAPTSSPAKGRESDVRSAMKLYVDAFERRDVDALRQIWPTIGAQYEGFKLFFGDAQSIRMHMEIESMKFDPDGTNVVVTVKLLREYTGPDSKTMHLNERETFQLSKLTGSWTITEVDATF